MRPPHAEHSPVGTAVLERHAMNLRRFKQIPVIEIARRLGILVHGTKAMCFSQHDKRTPSLSFHVRDNYWRCFGSCGKGGDGISLVRQVLNVDFNTALHWLQREFDISDTFWKVPAGRDQCGPKNIQRSLPPFATTVDPPADPDSDLFLSLLTTCRPVSHPCGIAYLRKHGISSETADQFEIREMSNAGAASE